MNSITPCLWFDNNAEEAVNHYLSIFKDSKVTSVSRYGEGAPMPAGTVLVMSFELNGQKFTALNGGPAFKFNPAISFMILCKTQEEIDHYWDKLSEGGSKDRCGWLTDRYGMSWQVAPEIISWLYNGEDKEASKRALQAMMTMSKLDIATLLAAYNGEPVAQ